MKQLIYCLLFTFFTPHLFAQELNSYASVDNYVNKIGSLDSFNVATIADTITKPFDTKRNKARAIYYWIANNIAIDPKASHSNDNKNAHPALVNQFRKANSKGFAWLFQEMCSLANIRCLVVDGFTRNTTEDFDNIPDDANYSWNVVQLGKSAEEWFYVDVTKASGSLDKRQTVFTKEFTSNCFFADKQLFNLDHYPINSAWMFGEGTRSIKDFFSLPIIGKKAYSVGLQNPSPKNVFIKTTLSKSVRFSFSYTQQSSIKNLSLQIGEGNKTIKPQAFNFNDEEGTISFNYTFKKEGEFPVRILVDNKEILTYYIEVNE